VAALSSDKPAILTGNMMSSQCFETENSSQLKRWHPYQWHRITTGQNDQLDHRGGSAPRDKRLLAISLSLSQPGDGFPTDTGALPVGRRPKAQKTWPTKILAAMKVDNCRLIVPIRFFFILRTIDGLV